MDDLAADRLTACPAQQIYATAVREMLDDAVIEDGRSDSRVEHAVRLLMRMALGAEEGTFLGKEPDLLAKLEISRPTLRQAAKIVANDQLIEIRRGASGGFYASRPEARRVTESPALYLRLQGATLADMLAVIGRVTPALVREATDHTTRDQREDFSNLLSTCPEVPPTRELLRIERELMRRIGKLSANRVFEFLIEFSYTFGEFEDSIRLYESAGHRSEWRDLQDQMIAAIVAGDGQLAEFYSERRFKVLRQWLAEEGPADGRA